MYTLFVLTFALLVALLGGVPLGNAFNGNSQKLYAHGPAAVMIERLMRVMRIVVLALLGFACGGSKATPPDALGCGGGCDAQNPDALLFPYTLDGNRDRLLHTYLWWLQSDPNTQQSNGLAGRDLHTVCDLWSKLDPSPRAVFLTITHRLEGSLLGSDHSAMLDHVTKLYRVVGGQGETATTAGSCGGAEYNRMIMSSDSALHDVQVAANTHQGAVQGT
ncbi:MAG: Peptidyl-prolyl cis-trans isomerase, partial [Myxococcales bacterium]|nr:Peptidyl-prolyl cis-trans isomerase [Myxococcales bacterium]